MSCSRLSWFLTATSTAASLRASASEAGTLVPGPRGDDLENAGPVGAWFRTEDPGLLRTSGGERIELRRLVSSTGSQSHGLVEEAQDVGKGVPEEPRHPQGHLHPRTAQLLEVDQFDPLDPLILRPHRPDTDQREHLGDIVATGSHRTRAPGHQADRG